MAPDVPMHSAMNGPGHEQLSGAHELRARGPEDHREVAQTVDPRQSDLLVAGTAPCPETLIVVRPADIEVVVAPEWSPTSTTRRWSSPRATWVPTAGVPTAVPPSDAEPTDRSLLARLLRRIGQIVCMTLVVPCR